MFWRFGGYANISSIDSILEKPNVSLDELLDESDLIQELKQNNSKLIEFLREESTLQTLLEYVVADTPPHSDKASSTTREDEPDRSSPISFFKKSASRSRSKSVNKSDTHGDAEGDEEDKGEALRKKYAYVACEVLSSDVWSITEAVLEYQNYLREFWHYVSRPAPLDPLQAGYFTKVNESLLDKKTDEMLAFFKSLDHIVPDMLQHVDCPMIMDLLLKIISLEKAPGGQGIVDVSRVAPSIIPRIADKFPKVVTNTGPHPRSLVLPWPRKQRFYSDSGWRLLESNHYHFRERYHSGSNCYWPQRIDQTTRL